jgi:hypothetical protein
LIFWPLLNKLFGAPEDKKLDDASQVTE